MLCWIRKILKQVFGSSSVMKKMKKAWSTMEAPLWLIQYLWQDLFPGLTDKVAEKLSQPFMQPQIYLQCIRNTSVLEHFEFLVTLKECGSMH